MSTFGLVAAMLSLIISLYILRTHPRNSHRKDRMKRQRVKPLTQKQMKRFEELFEDMEEPDSISIAGWEFSDNRLWDPDGEEWKLSDEQNFRFN